MKKWVIALMGRTFPDSRRSDDPDPARIWSGNLVEQKKGSSTDLRMAWICFLSVVNKCFLETDRTVVVLGFSSCENTTAGIRPWARSLTETLFPVHSLGMAWIVWYRAEKDWNGACCREQGCCRTARRLPPAERHRLAIFFLFGCCFGAWFLLVRVLHLLSGFKGLGLRREVTFLPY